MTVETEREAEMAEAVVGDGWLAAFDERQRSEISFSRTYVASFGHGTDGHQAKVIIANMADQLDRFERERAERLKGKTLEAVAADAYNRYYVSAGGKNFSGGAMPTWQELPDAIRGHWVSAIGGVI